MNKVLQAIYQNGNLVLDEKLDAALEGKKLTLILIEEEMPSNVVQSEVNLSDGENRKQQFLEKAKQYAAKLAPGYHFDREEAHER